MNFLVTADTQTPKISLVIRPAIGKGLHIMHQRCHACSPQPQALLTERMRRDMFSVKQISPFSSSDGQVRLAGADRAVEDEHLLVTVLRLGGVIMLPIQADLPIAVCLEPFIAADGECLPRQRAQRSTVFPQSGIHYCSNL